VVFGTQLLEDADSALLILHVARYSVSKTNISKNNLFTADCMKGLLRDAKLRRRQFIQLRRPCISHRSLKLRLEASKHIIWLA
jgi:hypothetical protein